MTLTPEVQQIVDAAKKANHSVFSIPIHGSNYVYRSINRAEFRALQNQLFDQAEQARKAIQDEKALAVALDKVKDDGESRLVTLATLHPKLTEAELNNSGAGLVPTLADFIMRASNFGVDLEPTQL